MARKVRNSGRERKGLKLLEGERAFVGDDVHRGTYSVCVWTDQREQVAQWVQPAAPKALLRRLETLREHLVRGV